MDKRLTLYTLEEAAAILGYTMGKMAELRWRREIAVIPGSPVMVTQEDLEDYVARRELRAARAKAYESRFD